MEYLNIQTITQCSQNVPASFTGCPKSPFTESIFTFQENVALFRN